MGIFFKKIQDLLFTAIQDILYSYRHQQDAEHEQGTEFGLFKNLTAPIQVPEESASGLDECAG